MNVSDDTLRQIFRTTRVIACVGASPNPDRPSHYVSKYLAARGYRVIGVNPGQAGKSLFGTAAVASLANVSEPVDMVDIFRRSDRVAEVVEEALACLPALKTIWMQIGVFDAQAASMARARGVTVVQNRCPKIEFPRLFGPMATAESARLCA